MDDSRMKREGGKRMGDGDCQVADPGGLNVLIHGLMVISVEQAGVRLIIPGNVPNHCYKAGSADNLQLMNDDFYYLEGVTPGPRRVPPSYEHIVLKAACGAPVNTSLCKIVQLPLPDYILPFRPARCLGAMSGSTVQNNGIYPDYLQILWVMRYEKINNPTLFRRGHTPFWTGTGKGTFNLHIHASLPMPDPNTVSHLPHLNELFSPVLDILIDSTYLPKTVPTDCSGGSIGISPDDQRDLMEIPWGRNRAGAGGDPSNCIGYFYDPIG